MSVFDMKAEQQFLRDCIEGDKLKSEGMERAAAARHEVLILARETAQRIARERGTVTVDDVRNAHYWMNLGPAWGSVFTGPEWEWTGEWKRSTTPSNHARMVRVWRLKP